MSLCLVAVREGYDGDSLYLFLVVVCFACCDTHYAWDPTVGLKRK